MCRDRHVKIPYEDLDRSVFSVIKKHMQICIEKISLIQKLNATDSANIQYKVLNRQLDKLRNERKRIISRGKGLYEDYKDKFITAYHHSTTSLLYSCPDISLSQIQKRLQSPESIFVSLETLL